MKLDKVQISHFRNIDDLSLVAHGSLNVFLGENGSGKSSILEALHYLGYARSFVPINIKMLLATKNAVLRFFVRLLLRTESNKSLE